MASNITKRVGLAMAFMRDVALLQHQFILARHIVRGILSLQPAPQQELAQILQKLNESKIDEHTLQMIQSTAPVRALLVQQGKEQAALDLLDSQMPAHLKTDEQRANVLAQWAEQERKLVVPLVEHALQALLQQTTPLQRNNVLAQQPLQKPWDEASQKEIKNAGAQLTKPQLKTPQREKWIGYWTALLQAAQEAQTAHQQQQQKEMEEKQFVAQQKAMMDDLLNSLISGESSGTYLGGPEESLQMPTIVEQTEQKPQQLAQQPEQKQELAPPANLAQPLSFGVPAEELLPLDEAPAQHQPFPEPTLSFMDTSSSSASSQEQQATAAVLTSATPMEIKLPQDITPVLPFHEQLEAEPALASTTVQQPATAPAKEERKSPGLAAAEAGIPIDEAYMAADEFIQQPQAVQLVLDDLLQEPIELWDQNQRKFKGGLTLLQPETALHTMFWGVDWMKELNHNNPRDFVTTQLSYLAVCEVYAAKLEQTSSAYDYDRRRRFVVALDSLLQGIPRARVTSVGWFAGESRLTTTDNKQDVQRSQSGKHSPSCHCCV
jgi:hypothetical protein